MISAVSTLSRPLTAATGHASKTGRFQSVEDRFIENWGRLAEGFGMQRAAGQVHAVLYLASCPLDAGAIADHLDLNSELCAEHLATLVSFGVVHSDSAAGVFEAERDPWSWFMITLRERARREFAPLLESIRAVNALAQEAKNAPHIKADRERSERMQRIGQFTHFVDQIAGLLEMFSHLGAGPLVATMRMAARFMPHR